MTGNHGPLLPAASRQLEVRSATPCPPVVGLTFSIEALLVACCPLPTAGESIEFLSPLGLCRGPMTGDRRPLPSESRLAALGSPRTLVPPYAF